MKAKQIQFNGVGQIEYITRELPQLKENQVLVKIEACGLCTWERYIYQGVEEMPFPFVGGHELAGTIVETGPEVKGLQPGMPVAVAKWVRCNECVYCRRGYDNHCTGNDGDSTKAYSGPGGFADYLVCNSYEIYPFSPNVPLHFAALGEPLACVIRGVNRMSLVPGDTVAVLGAGFMGLLFLQALKLKGCKVIMVQRSRKRRELAVDMGADYPVDPMEKDWVAQVRALTGDVGPVGVVYTAGGGKVLNECLEAAGIGATVMMYAPLHEKEPSIVADLIHFKELTVTGALRHDKESFRQSVRLLGSGMLNLDKFQLAFGDFNQLEEEMERAGKDRDIHRILLRWQEN